MKIPNQVKNEYERLCDQLSLLQKDVRPFLEEICNRNDWFIRSRLKSLESFSQKLETLPDYKKGGYDDVLGFEIVINNRNEISNLKESLEEHFDIHNQRPSDHQHTKLQPDSFRFNDLRFYVKKKQSETTESKEFRNYQFELQVKTIFSHAWSKATHDLIYKGAQVSWARERVSFQIKAMIEQSEYAISNIEKTDDTFFPTHERYVNLEKLISIIRRWPDGLRPKDLKRCAENVLNISEMLDFKPADSLSLLEATITNEYIGNKVNVSPFHVCFIVLVQSLDLNKLPNNKSRYSKILYTRELDEHLEATCVSILMDKNYLFEP